MRRQVGVLGMVLMLGTLLTGCAPSSGQAAPNPSLDPPAPVGKTDTLAVESLAHDGTKLDTGQWKTVLLPEPLEGGTISVPGVCNGPSFTIESVEGGRWKTIKSDTENAAGCSTAGHELKTAVIAALTGEISATRTNGKTVLTRGGYTLTLSGP